MNDTPLQITDNNPLIEAPVVRLGAPLIVIQDSTGKVVSSVQTKIED